MAGYNAVVADYMINQTKDVVVEKIKDLDALSRRYNNELSVALSDIGSVSIAPVLAPTRLQAPTAPPPNTELGNFPTYERGSLSIPVMPSMKDIDSILGNLDLPDLGPMPAAPAELALSTPQAPSIDTIYVPLRPDIDSSVEFAPVPTINDLVMPDRITTSITIDIPDAPTLNAIAMPARPDISLDVSMPDAPSLKDHALPDSPDFDMAVTLPVMPVIDQLNAPQRPTVDTNIDIPDMKDIVLPDLEALENIEIAGFDIPDFDIPESPNKDFDPEVYVFNNDWWEEPAEYESAMLDQLSTLSKDMLDNPEHFGLPEPVVRALFNKPRERISAEVERSVQEASNTWAGRGFSMPPGMLAKQVNVARQEGQLKVADLNRDILIEASKMQIEALRFAVTQGMALEQRTYDRHKEVVERLFEVAKYNVEATFRAYEY